MGARGAATSDRRGVAPPAAATAAVATGVPSRGPAAPHVSTWFGTGRRRNQTPGQRGAGRSRRPPPRLPAGLRAAPSQATPLLARARSGRCSRRVAIGPLWSWAEPGPRRHWPALEVGGARAPATEQRGARGGGACTLRLGSSAPHSLRGVSPRVGARRGGGGGSGPSTCRYVA